MGPTKKNQTKDDEKQNQVGRGVTKERGERDSFKFFLFSLVISQIYENQTVGFRQDKHEKCSRKRGLRVGTKNTGFHREFR